jgi:HPt (histidine-containing phosphotransfer) domain-containing protein
MGLEKILIHVDPDLADECPWYLDRLKEYVVAIDRAIHHEDLATIQDTGHRMKGSGANFGFEAVSDLGKSLEQAAKDKNLKSIKIYKETLADYLGRIELVYG